MTARPNATTPAKFTRDEFLAWLSLLEASLDQPAPTKALRLAIRAVTGERGGPRGAHCATCGADDWYAYVRPGRAFSCAPCFDRSAA